MRYQLTIFALALSITSASAASLTDIPSCAYAPALNSAGASGCTLTDLSCICKSTAWLNSLLPEVSKACPAADLEKTRAITVDLCKNAGVDLVLPSGTTGTIAPATASATKSGTTGVATSIASVVSSQSSSASAAIASATATGSAMSFGPPSGLLGMMGIAMGMIVFNGLLTASG